MKNQINKNIQQSKEKENEIENKLVVEKLYSTPESQFMQNIILNTAQFYNRNNKSRNLSYMKGEA